MTAGFAAILDEAVISALGAIALVVIVALLDRAREAPASPRPRVLGPRAGVRRTERDAPLDPGTVARDAQIIAAWQRSETPGRHAAGGVR